MDCCRYCFQPLPASTVYSHKKDPRHGAMTPNNRIATHPGIILRVMIPGSITVKRWCADKGIPYGTVRSIMYSKQKVAIKTAFELAKSTNTTPEYWLTLQMHYDISTFRAKMK